MTNSVAVREDGFFVLSSALTLGLDGTPEAQQQAGSIQIYNFDWSDWLASGDETSALDLSGVNCTPGLFRWDGEPLSSSVNVYVRDVGERALVTTGVSTVLGAKINIPLRLHPVSPA